MSNESIFSIGDKVVITDEGENYTTYTEMYESMNFENKEHKRGAAKNEVCTVFAVGEHEYKDAVLLGLSRNNGEQALVGVDGCQIIKKEE